MSSLERSLSEFHIVFIPHKTIGTYEENTFEKFYHKNKVKLQSGMESYAYSWSVTHPSNSTSMNWWEAEAFYARLHGLKPPNRPNE